MYIYTVPAGQAARMGRAGDAGRHLGRGETGVHSRGDALDRALALHLESIDGSVVVGDLVDVQQLVAVSRDCLE